MTLSLDGLELVELRLAGRPVHIPKRLPGGKRHWSHAAQAQAERCPAAFKRRYIDRLDDPPSSAMVAGGAFGAALQYAYATALTGGLPPADECADVAVAHRDERLPDARLRDGETPAGLRDQVTTAARAYVSERAPHVLDELGGALRAVERRFDLRLTGTDESGRPAACEWTIRGYVDLDADAELRDFKLVGKAHPTQAEADHSPQGTLYLLARAAEGGPAERFVLDSTRREHGPRSTTPRFAEVPTERAERALVAYQERIAGTVLMLALCERTGSWPYSTAGWWCAAGQCGAWDGCVGGALSAGQRPRADVDADRRAAA
jgi:RecB family exonuclease